MKGISNWIACALIVIGAMFFVVLSFGLSRPAGMMTGMTMSMWTVPMMLIFLILIGIIAVFMVPLIEGRVKRRVRCPDCEQHVQSTWAYCPHCGSPLKRW